MAAKRSAGTSARKRPRKSRNTPAATSTTLQARSEDSGLALQAAPADELLSLEQAVQYLGSSKPTIYRLLSQGDLRGLKVGRQWRFRRDALEAYVERRPMAGGATSMRAAETELEYFSSELRRSLPDLTALDGPETEKTSPDEGLLRRLVRALMLAAIQTGASDIHIEPQRDCILVRFRIDGLLHEARRLPLVLLEPIVNSIKELSGMNTEEKRLPQDGRLPLAVEDRHFDIRIALCPGVLGEALSMRVLAQATSASRSIDQLGLAAEDSERLVRWLQRPYGVVLFTGSAGSGRTTTLYSCIQEVTSPGNKVVSVEDPVQYQLPGVLQVHVNRSARLLYPNALRSLLRQDPDVIAAGEIRDVETAEILHDAAMTGRLALSSMHAGSAVEVIVRLRDMGLEPFVMASGLIGISAQRLPRLLCRHCKYKESLTQEALHQAEHLAKEGGYRLPADATFMKAAGCEHCRQTGYLGRIAIYELLECSPTIAGALIRGASPEELTQLAVQGGMTTMLADGIRKAAQGLTSIEEVKRILAITSF